MGILWKIRRALRPDMEAMCRIERACVEAPHWKEAVWIQVLGGVEESEHARANLVAEDSEGVVGFAVVSCACGVANLESVAVVQEARRHGIGRALCKAAMVWAAAETAQTIELEVRASSLGALTLYGSLGFIEQGRRPGYYRDPTDDAVLMSASLQAKHCVDG